MGMARATSLVLLACLTGAAADTFNCHTYYNSGFDLTSVTSEGKALMFVAHEQKNSQLCKVDVRKFGGDAVELCTDVFGKYPRVFTGYQSADGSRGLAFYVDLYEKTTLYSLDVGKLSSGSSSGIRSLGPVISYGGHLSADWKTMVNTIQSPDPNNQGIVVTYLDKLGTPQATSLWPTNKYNLLSFTSDNSIGLGPFGGQGMQKKVEGDQICLVYINTIANGTEPKIRCSAKLPPSLKAWYPKISPDGKRVGWWVRESQYACFMTTDDMLAGDYPSCLKGPAALRWDIGLNYFADKYAIMRGNCALDLDKFLKDNTTNYGCAEDIPSPTKTPVTPGTTSEDGSVTYSWVHEGNTISSTVAHVCRTTLSEMAANSQSGTVCKNLQKIENSQYYHGITPISSTEAIVSIAGTECYWKM